MSRSTAFPNLGQLWWSWVVKYAPDENSTSRRNVAEALGISHQAVSSLIEKNCTIDRMSKYTTARGAHGWPDVRIVIEGSEITLIAGYRITRPFEAAASEG